MQEEQPSSHKPASHVFFFHFHGLSSEPILWQPSRNGFVVLRGEVKELSAIKQHILAVYQQKSVQAYNQLISRIAIYTDPRINQSFLEYPYKLLFSLFGPPQSLFAKKPASQQLTLTDPSHLTNFQDVILPMLLAQINSAIKPSELANLYKMIVDTTNTKFEPTIKLFMQTNCKDIAMLKEAISAASIIRQCLRGNFLVLEEFQCKIHGQELAQITLKALKIARDSYETPSTTQEDPATSRDVKKAKLDPTPAAGEDPEDRRPSNR